MSPSNRRSSIILVITLVLATLWMAGSLLVVRPVIEGAYLEQSWPVLNSVFSGRDVHPIEFYFDAWNRVSLKVLVVLITVGLATAGALRPEFQSLGRQRRLLLLWTAFLVLSAAFLLWDLHGEWSEIHGFEDERIAQSIADGHGFSFSWKHRWLYRDSESTPGRYYPSAWKEPVHPFLIAWSFRLLGEFGRLLVLVLQISFLMLTAVALVALGRRVFGLGTGLLAASILMLLPHVRALPKHSLSNDTLAGLTVVFSSYALFWALDRPGFRRVMILGATLGLASLALFSTIVFIPIAAILTAWSLRSSPTVAGKTVLILLLTASAVILPWTVRNAVVLGQPVPVRTGGGFNIYLGTAFLAEATTPYEACAEPWQAKRTRSVHEVMHSNREDREEIYRRARRCIEVEAPAGYSELNEAERDSLYLRSAVRFALTHPVTLIRLTIVKGLQFLRGWSGPDPLIALLAVIGVGLALRTPRTRPLLILVVVCPLPAIMALPLFYRYRYPVEPLLILLASHALVVAVLQVRKRWRAKN